MRISKLYKNLTICDVKKRNRFSGSAFSWPKASLDTLMKLRRGTAGFVSLTLIVSHAADVGAENNVAFLTTAMRRRTV